MLIEIISGQSHGCDSGNDNSLWDQPDDLVNAFGCTSVIGALPWSIPSCDKAKEKILARIFFLFSLLWNCKCNSVGEGVREYSPFIFFPCYWFLRSEIDLVGEGVRALCVLQQIRLAWGRLDWFEADGKYVQTKRLNLRCFVNSSSLSLHLFTCRRHSIYMSSVYLGW